MRQENKQACFLVPNKRFHYFFFLYMWEPILSEVVITQNTYSKKKKKKKKDLDLIQCASKIRNLDDFLQRQRESLVAEQWPKQHTLFVKRWESPLNGKFAEERECLVKRLMMLV